MLKYFTNALEGNASQSLAINPAHVITVFQSIYNKEVDEAIVSKEVTSIYVVTNIVYHVTDPYLEVIARLNERD